MIKVGIVGGTGYTGVELLRLLANHPQVSLTVITSRSEAGREVSDVFPNLSGHVDLAFTPPSIEALRDCDLVFFATPNGTAMQFAASLLAEDVRVIDLAADFRLRDVELWQRWYGMEHTAQELLQEAVYGLPEVNREAIAAARLVANPGCYPTAVQLGFLPLLENGMVDARTLIADAKSGISGAGRSAKLSNLYGETADNFKAYGVFGHRHQPEIRQGLHDVAGSDIGLTFVPHLTPMIRGIHATLYAQLKPGVDADLQSTFEKRFCDEPFVEVLAPGSHPDTRSVRGSNYCRLAVHRNGQDGTVVVLAVIDNLVKGAAGQAVQNMNIMLGIPEATGLSGIALLP